ncbi:ATP18 [Candida theae]|uniref:ATP18 n=1 Tax=Candida theae TaxID=1198502 RepID=A0AAD5BDF5_9ASCO|nr:ATP18 [Candida theae]KAI5957507.1 ATP18 [Candida theae]
MPSLPKYPFPVLKTYWPYAVGEISRSQSRGGTSTSFPSMSTMLPELRTFSLLTIDNIAGVTYYLIYKASIASANSDEFINDPRNPRFKNGGKFIDLNKKEEAH